MGEFQLYRCTECGKVSVSLGWIHGHAEKHNGLGPFNIIPDPRRTANPDALNEFIEVIEVESFKQVPAKEAAIRNGGEIDNEVFK